MFRSPPASALGACLPVLGVKVGVSVAPRRCSSSICGEPADQRFLMLRAASREACLSCVATPRSPTLTGELSEGGPPAAEAELVVLVGVETR